MTNDTPGEERRPDSFPHVAQVRPRKVRVARVRRTISLEYALDQQVYAEVRRRNSTYSWVVEALLRAALDAPGAEGRAAS